MLRLAQKKGVVIRECRRMGRNDLVHLDYLVDQVSVSSFIVERFNRLRDLTFLEISDRRIVLRLELVDLEV